MKLAGQYAKFLTAIAGYGLTFAQFQYGGANPWVRLATAIFASLGVAAVPNKPKDTPQP